MRIARLILLACVLSSPASAADALYEGDWRTTNRKLDGRMTCAVTELGPEKWRGRFYGVWQGVPFDYTLDFAGPATALRGTARIDGADYVWTGKMSGDSFQGSFGGNRYTGHFQLAKRPGKTVRER